jgi:hypothetical protein
MRGQIGTIMPNGDKTFLFVLYICSAEGALSYKNPPLNRRKSIKYIISTAEELATMKGPTTREKSTCPGGIYRSTQSICSKFRCHVERSPFPGLELNFLNYGINFISLADKNDFNIYPARRQNIGHRSDRNPDTIFPSPQERKNRTTNTINDGF